MADEIKRFKNLTQELADKVEGKEQTGIYKNVNFKKRLGKAERALLKIDSITPDSERPSKIVAEYFDDINKEVV